MCVFHHPILHRSPSYLIWVVRVVRVSVSVVLRLMLTFDGCWFGCTVGAH